MNSKLKIDRLVTICMCIILGDSLLNYFLKTFLRPIPINAMVIPIFFVLSLNYKIRDIFPRPTVVLWLFLAVIGYIIGVINTPDITSHRFLEIGSAIIAFLVGFAYFKANDDHDSIARLFLSITIIYVLVCIIALSQAIPTVFPIRDQIWSQEGVLQRRPEVTTDQNFQIFYLFPSAFLLALPFRLKRSILIFCSIICSLYILAKLQTRSGSLVLISAVILALLAPLFIRSLGRRKVVILPILGALGIMATFPIILSSADLLLYRFFEAGYMTLYGRMHSIAYLFEHVWNPLWWLPQGNEAFVAATGFKPHSNVTAVFLEGGILGLAAWIAIILFPLFKLGARFVKGKMSNASAIVFIGCLTMFIVQLSLNVPMVDQVWLWAGAGIGLCDKEAAREKRTNAVS